jgi:dihydrofolate reductase
MGSCRRRAGPPDEDPRGGFQHGGWAQPCNDPVMGKVAGEGMADTGATLLGGDAAEAVARLKQQPGKDLTVLGSGALIQSLRRRDLVDRYVLLIHPLVLGSGRRLFPDGGPSAELQLVDAVTTTTGVVIATYRPAEPAAGTTA